MYTRTNEDSILTMQKNILTVEILFKTLEETYAYYGPFLRKKIWEVGDFFASFVALIVFDNCDIK